MKESHVTIYKYFTKQQVTTSNVPKGDELYCILYTIIIFEVINIDFWQIWLFDVKDAGYVGL